MRDVRLAAPLAGASDQLVGNKLRDDEANADATSKRRRGAGRFAEADSRRNLIAQDLPRRKFADKINILTNLPFIMRNVGAAATLAAASFAAFLRAANCGDAIGRN